MDRRFLIAMVKGCNHQWRVRLSDRQGEEKFIGRNGAIGYVEEIVAKENPVQLITFQGASENIAECWFLEPGKPKRRLSVNIIGEANARLEAPAASPEFTVMAIRPLGQATCPWHVISSDSTCVHDGCHDVEDAKKWIRDTVTRYKDHSPILLLVFNKADRMDEAWSLRGGGWRKLPLKVKHPEPGKNPFLYDGNRPSTQKQDTP